MPIEVKPQERDIPNTISSLSQLQGNCNVFEKKFTSLLDSLEAAKYANGDTFTRAVFKYFKDRKKEVGKLKIEEFSQARKGDAVFEGDVFVQGKLTKVLVFRGD